MKLRLRLTLVVAILLSNIQLQAQCADSTAMVQTFDTTVIGSSNDLYTFTFKKFDATIGTLTEVSLTSKVTLNFSFTLENKETSPISNYRVRLFRDHEISSDALLTPLTNTKSFTYGPYSLAANDGVNGSGPDYMAVGPIKPLNNYTVKQTVFNTADFMGTDTVAMDYLSSASSYATGSLNNVFTSTAQDTLRFSISYKYCPTSQLASDIQQVNAYRKEKLTYVKWNVVNEPAGREYFIQRNNNGRTFVNMEKIQADPSARGQYSYSFNSENEKGKAQFRIVAVDKNGKTSTSRVRLVEYAAEVNAAAVKLFPNPAVGAVQLMFSNTVRGDYDVQVLNMSGQVVKQYQFRNVLMARINEQNELRKGMYVIRSIDLKNKTQLTERLVIQ